MPFPQSFLDELVARSDIVDVVGSYVQLTRKGSNLFGLCPFHSEKTGSFSVSPDKQIYYCFGCKRGAASSISSWRKRTSPSPTRCGSWPSGPGWRCRRRTATGRQAGGGSACWT